VVNEMDSTLPRAIDRAIHAVALAVQRTVQRRRLKPLHHRASEAPIQRRIAAGSVVILVGHNPAAAIHKNPL
jgi:hypothetical protein